MPNIKEQKFPNKGIQSVGDTQMIKDSEGHYCSVCFEFYREKILQASKKKTWSHLKVQNQNGFRLQH